MGQRPRLALALARSCQLLACFVAIGLHGFLTIRVHGGRRMASLAVMTGAVLGYTIFAVIFQSGKRTKSACWVATFVLGDAIMCAILLVIITVLAYSGLPLHCGGLPDDDEVQLDPNDSTSIAVRYNTNGALGKLCTFERCFYVIAVGLVFTYIVTTVLAVLRFYEQHYTRNTQVSQLLDSLDRADDINLKLLESPSPAAESPGEGSPPPEPPSEGVITRTTSLRSTFTTATTSTTSQGPSANPCRTNCVPRRPVGPHSLPLPRRPLPPGAAMVPGPGTGAVPFEDGGSALVTDGMQHPRRLSRDHQQQPYPPMLSEEAQAAADAALFVADGMQHPHHASSSSSSSSLNHFHPHRHRRSQHSFSRRMPMLSEEEGGGGGGGGVGGGEDAADAALVSDGMRPSEPSLPSYHPGNNRMVGHAGESNEMRLSEYVKGETRAQNMKDSGNY
ncbi:hypothetical protein VTK26DRAFT_6441 [Humicola hyalothermophila]